MLTFATPPPLEEEAIVWPRFYRAFLAFLLGIIAGGQNCIGSSSWTITPARSEGSSGRNGKRRCRDSDWVGRSGKMEANQRAVMNTGPVSARSNISIVLVAGLLVALLPRIAVTMDTSSRFSFQICRCASLCAADQILVLSA